MLQGRLFSYGDTQRYRLGVNFNHIPVNAPKCPFHSYHRDGAMRTDGNLGRTPTYFPNSLGEWIDQPQLNEPPLAMAPVLAYTCEAGFSIDRPRETVGPKSFTARICQLRV